MASKKELGRREFLRYAGIGGAGVLLAACAAPTPETIIEKVVETVVVKETVMVEGKERVVEKVITKEVERVVTKEVEKVVEKVVTATAKPEPVTVTWLHHFGEDWQQPIFGKVIDRFQSAYPNIKVRLSYSPWEDHPGKMRAAALAGDTSFDIVDTNAEHIASLTTIGYFEDLEPWLQADPQFAASLSPEAPMKWEGKTRATAIYAFPFHLLYNVDLLKEKGLTPPSNWDEFRETARGLRDKEKGIYGYMATMAYGEVLTTRMFVYRLTQLGGWLFDDDGNVAFNSPEGLATIEWWKRFWDDDLINPASLTMPWPGIMELMAAGRLGCFTDGPFTAAYLKNMNPDINIAYAPPWRDKTGGICWDRTGIAMTTLSTCKEETWEFMKFLYGDEVALILTNELFGAPVPSKAVMASLRTSDNPVFAAVPDLFGQDPSHNIPKPIMANMEKLVDAMKQAFHEVMLDKKDAKTALEEVAKIWQDEINASRK